MTREKMLKEVTKSCFEAHRELKRKGGLKNQSHYRTGLESLGLSVPEMRQIYKREFSFSKAKHDEQFKTWSYIWKKSPYFEVKFLALTYTSQLGVQQLGPQWPIYKSWIDHIDNWAHSDSFSSDVARLLESYPKDVYPQLEEWNRSTNPWARRQSIVGLLYYSQSRKKTPPISKMLPLIQNLVDDPDYYVQKGVGWTLREVGNIGPKRMLNFVEKNLEALSSIAFTTALEKTDQHVKNELKKIRAKARKSK